MPSADHSQMLYHCPQLLYSPGLYGLKALGTVPLPGACLSLEPGRASKFTGRLDSRWYLAPALRASPGAVLAASSSPQTKAESHRKR